LQNVQESRSRGERAAGGQTQTRNGTAGGGDAGDQTGLRSNAGNGEQEKNGARVEQPAIAESHADHGRLRDQ